ncbi:fibronectin type III domain-containing protein [Glutamicibacter sp. 287]|uniref:fibronectin type III domain-containing protein n=1 Tax=unclassified Glutamicibacter TaxID=2627139 RepID=UPI00403324FF
MSPMMNATPWLRRGSVAAAVIALLGSTLVPAQAAPIDSAAESEYSVVVSAESTQWKYLDDGTDPAAGQPNLDVWTATDFDDSTWKSATGSFGAKHGSLGAVGPYTPKTLLNHYLGGQTGTATPAYFFRTQFELPEGGADDFLTVTGEVVYDDALVMWINGTKVAGFLDDRLTGESNQEYAGASNGNPVSSSFEVPADVLVDGVNTVAISLHNDRAGSSDIYLDVPELSLNVTEDIDPISRVILTPTETPARSQYVSWMAGSAGAATGTVEFRETSGEDVLTVAAEFIDPVNGNPLPHFSAELKDLKPGTSYSYRVANGSNTSEWNSFTTADTAVTDFQYIYYGDAQIGLDTTWPKVVAQAQETAPDAVGSVHAGDLINTGSNENEWDNWFKGMEQSAATANVMAAPGNHEYSGDNKLSAWKANFEYPRNNPSVETAGELAKLTSGDTAAAAQYRALFEHWTTFAEETVYFTDYQGVRFITVNATRDAGFLTPDSLPACSGDDCPASKISTLWVQFQAAWMDHILEKSKSKWNVVTFHQPVYSASAGRNEPVLREEWVPVFQKHNIDLVQMGHDHVYSRGYNNDNVTDFAGVTDGPVYIVSNSGAKHYDLADENDNVWTQNNATQVKRGEDFTTYQVIDVAEDTLTYKSYLAEKTASSTTDLAIGEVYDSFTVTKNDSGTKWVTEAGVEVPVVEEAIDVELSVSSRCIGKNTMLNVNATNNEDSPITLQVSSEFGNKKMNNVGPGKSASAPLNAGKAPLEAGSVTVKATHGTAEVAKEVSYDALSCK